MQAEQAISILEMLVKGDSLMQIVFFAYNVIWLVVACTLYKIFRLKFLKILAAESILCLVAWFWHNRLYFFSFPNGASYGLSVCFSIIDFLIRNIPTLVGLIGAIMGLKYLQTIKKDRGEGST